MKNGKISTSDMIRLLMKHAKDAVPWTASAPYGSNWKHMTAQVEHGSLGIRVFCGMDPLTTIPWREDWTIHQIPNNLQCIGEFKQYGHYTDGLLALTSDLKDLPKGTFRVYVESKP